MFFVITEVADRLTLFRLNHNFKHTSLENILLSFIPLETVGQKCLDRNTESTSFKLAYVIHLLCYVLFIPPHPHDS